jgi:hypothetical protein
VRPSLWGKFGGFSYFFFPEIILTFVGAIASK